MEKNNKTWKELLELKAGTIVEDYIEEGLRIIIMRGPASLCAYVGIPSEHPLAGLDYDSVDINCHGGLTFAREGAKDSFWPEGYYWYGWDYAHYGDWSFHDSKYGTGADGVNWLIQDVKRDSESTILDFKRLMKIKEADND